jgi:hypothetical protein
MAYYRLYHRRNGHIFGVEELWAEDDVGAVRLAQQKLAGDVSDLWCGARRIASFDAATQPSALTA